MTRKKTKSQGQNEPENEQNQPENPKMERARRKKGVEEKKAMAALLVFTLTSLKETEQ